jgi:putative membrane protein
MSHYYWNDWYAGWGWFLWFGIIFLLFSTMGNWGYTYRAHRKFDDGYPTKNAIDILNERLARGDIKQDEYVRIKSHILSPQKVSQNLSKDDDVSRKIAS